MASKDQNGKRGLLKLGVAAAAGAAASYGARALWQQFPGMAKTAAGEVGKAADKVSAGAAKGASRVAGGAKQNASRAASGPRRSTTTRKTSAKAPAARPAGSKSSTGKSRSSSGKSRSSTGKSRSSSGKSRSSAGQTQARKPAPDR